MPNLTYTQKRKAANRRATMARVALIGAMGAFNVCAFAGSLTATVWALMAVCVTGLIGTFMPYR